MYPDQELSHLVESLSLFVLPTSIVSILISALAAVHGQPRANNHLSRTQVPAPDFLPCSPVYGERIHFDSCLSALEQMPTGDQMVLYSTKPTENPLRVQEIVQEIFLPATYVGAAPVGVFFSSSISSQYKSK